MWHAMGASMDKRITSGEFDIQEYIKKTLLNTDNVEDRRILRDMMNGVFLPLFEYVDSKYDNLEKRVEQDFTGINNRLDIFTGIIEKSRYEMDAHHMYPMSEEDLINTKLNLKEVYREWKKKGKGHLYRVFIDWDYLNLKELINSKRKFSGVIKTEYEEYAAIFEIILNQTYIQQLLELYIVFQRNGIEWRTVCAPYLYKIFDIYLCQTTCPDDEEIESVQIDFQEYKRYIKQGYMPIWNITKIQEKTSTYPELCIDKLHYKHIIYKHRLKPDMEYIVGNTDVRILNVIREDGDFVITCGEKQPQRWPLYVIDKKEPEFLTMETFGNGYKQFSLLDNKASQNKRIRTKAEIEHFIFSMGYERYMELTGIKQVEGDVIPEATYCMDSFVEEEIRLHKNTHSLILEFMPKRLDNYLNYDILSYLVTRVQWFYPEFNCIGSFGNYKINEGESL
jgi:hypothetical protein